jgi:predicted AlkP superfamily phosphohydrolase/phosphomutase
MKKSTSSKKLVIFGIDGASWNVLDLVISKGWMPCLGELKSKYSGRGLISSDPPQTYPAWINFSTGTDPSVHSIHGFLKDKGFDNLELRTESTQIDSRVETFYNVLDNAGKSCILINLPGAFPLNLKHGSGLGSFVDRDVLYYPDSLGEQIPEVKSYRVFPDYFSERVGLVDIVSDHISLSRERFAVTKELFKGDWDFFFFLVSTYDFLFHKIGNERTLKEALSTKGMDVYFREIDKQISWFVDNLGKANFVMMSDHGMKEYKWVFHVNRWLEEQGLLHFKKLLYKDFKELPLTISLFSDDAKKRGGLFSLAFSFLDKFPFMYSIIGQTLRSFPKLFPKYVKTRMCEWGLEVDNKRTKALAINAYFIMTDLNRSKLKTLQKSLKDLKLPDGKPVFSDVLLSKEFFKGPFRDEMPDVLLMLDKALVDHPLWSRSIFSKKRNIHHRQEGFFLAFGPDVKLGKSSNYNIEDIAPTVLKLFSVPIPKYMKGKPIF